MCQLFVELNLQKVLQKAFYWYPWVSFELVKWNMPVDNYVRNKLKKGRHSYAETSQFALQIK